MDSLFSRSRKRSTDSQQSNPSQSTDSEQEGMPDMDDKTYEKARTNARRWWTTWEDARSALGPEEVVGDASGGEEAKLNRVELPADFSHCTTSPPGTPRQTNFVPSIPPPSPQPNSSNNDISTPSSPSLITDIAIFTRRYTADTSTLPGFTPILSTGGGGIAEDSLTGKTMSESALQHLASAFGSPTPLPSPKSLKSRLSQSDPSTDPEPTIFTYTSSNISPFSPTTALLGLGSIFGLVYLTRRLRDRRMARRIDAVLGQNIEKRFKIMERMMAERLGGGIGRGGEGGGMGGIASTELGGSTTSVAKDLMDKRTMEGIKNELLMGLRPFLREEFRTAGLSGVGEDKVGLEDGGTGNPSPILTAVKELAAFVAKTNLDLQNMASGMESLSKAVDHKISAQSTSLEQNLSSEISELRESLEEAGLLQIWEEDDTTSEPELMQRLARMEESLKEGLKSSEVRFDGLEKRLEVMGEILKVNDNSAASSGPSSIAHTADVIALEAKIASLSDTVNALNLSLVQKANSQEADKKGGSGGTTPFNLDHKQMQSGQSMENMTGGLLEDSGQPGESEWPFECPSPGPVFEERAAEPETKTRSAEDSAMGVNEQAVTGYWKIRESTTIETPDSSRTTVQWRSGVFPEVKTPEEIIRERLRATALDPSAYKRGHEMEDIERSLLEERKRRGTKGAGRRE